MSTPFIPRDYSLREQDLIEPEREHQRSCSPFCACRVWAPEPIPTGRFYATEAERGVVLSCHHILVPGMRYHVDAALESRCDPCEEEAD
jgi:hypothetical protein